MATTGFEEAGAFTRGFLLAQDWAGWPAEADVATRIPALAGSDVTALGTALRALPIATRRALRTSWAKRDRLVRIDTAIDLHPSWIAELLRPEPPALALLALGELQEDLARHVLREFYAGQRPPEAATEGLRPLVPSDGGAFRRALYAPFVHIAHPERRATILAPLLALDVGQLWLLAQECGRRELARLGGTLRGDHPSPRMRLAWATGAEDQERTGLLGFHLLAELVAPHPRAEACLLAQRMARTIGLPFLRWRDAIAATAGEGEAADPTGTDRDPPSRPRASDPSAPDARLAAILARAQALATMSGERTR